MTPAPNLDDLLQSFAQLPVADRQQFIRQARNLLPRQPRGAYFAARNAQIRRLHHVRGLSAGQIAALPDIDMSREAVLKVLQRARKQRQ